VAVGWSCRAWIPANPASGSEETPEVVYVNRSGTPSVAGVTGAEPSWNRTDFGGGARPLREKRRHVRKALFMGVHYTAAGRNHNDFIENISTGGAFIQTRGPFFIGQRVSLVFPLPSYRIPVNITGEVVRISPQGIGLKFKLMAPVNSVGVLRELIAGEKYFLGPPESAKGIPKAGRKRVRWKASGAPGVTGYKLYWAVGDGVGYESDCAEVGYFNEAVLPDDFPSFPKVAGEIQLGLTAVNDIGNESDMTKFAVSFDFTAQRVQMSEQHAERLSFYDVG